MANLVSPGVEVTITDESQYLPAPSNSIPFILLATAQNKANPNGTGVAQATTSANAGRLFRVTSQRDLVTLYGNPFFYTTSNGTPIQGYELNEYGLLAAYSALGVTNTVYCLRADVDLASLVGSTGRPTGSPANGSYWLDTTTSSWGIHEFNSTTGQFVLKSPIVISDSTQVSNGAPLQSLGAIGDYAVIAIPTYSFPTASSAGQFFYKASNNTWVRIGTRDWLAAWPTAIGSNTNPTLTAGNTFVVGIGASSTVIAEIEIQSGWTVNQLASAINALGWDGLSASVDSGRLELFSTQTAKSFTDTNPFRITLSATGTLLSELGLVSGDYYQPDYFLGTASQQPLWQSGQTTPRPSGSVWVKVGIAGSGLNPVVSQYDSTLLSWTPKTVNFGTSDWNVIASLDSTGGKNIPAGSIYAQYNFNQTSNDNTNYKSGPVYYWERIATGATVVVGENTAPEFNSTTLGTAGPYTLQARVSIPGSASLSSFATVTIPNNADAVDFVTAWSAANIPFTTATVGTNGAIVLTHTEGGVIILNDINNNTGESNGVIAEIGLVAGTTLGVKEGPGVIESFNTVSTTTSGTGVNATLTVFVNYQNYFVDSTSIVNGGTDYAVGDIVTVAGSDLGGVDGANDLVLIVTGVSGLGAITALTFNSGVASAKYAVQLSNWVEFEMTANEGAPVAKPANNTNWFYSTVDQVDIMVNTASGWRGYKNVNFDSNGFPLPSGTNTTDPNGPIVSASEPEAQSDGTALAYGDLWIDTSDLENYPIINRWQSVDGVDTWVRIDNTNQTSPTGVVFADARWATSGSVSSTDDPIPSIVSLLSSNYLDLDAPSSNLYPVGMLLFNTRRSGYNVKQFKVNYFNGRDFPDQSLPAQRDAWVSASGLQSNGSPYMGRKAQRAMVVKAMSEAIDTNVAARDEDNFFNLMAAPGYPELQPNMIVLNADRGETGFIIGDTPMRLADDATAIQAWATNAAGATSTGEDGWVTRSTYMGLFYPSGITRDLRGNQVAVPASHMMIRTMLRNDSVAYPWLAPAGTRRGIIDNAEGIGYINAQTGEFVSIRTRIGIRDVLYTNQINPLVFFTGNGLLNYGNKSSFNSQSALDRINVARLTAYLRRQFTLAARPFIFEPNDSLTRQQISGVFETLLIELVGTRGVYDYLVVCDESNNTPARIDRNELWIDVAIEPVKAVEFIYIPVRIFNTGELSAGR